MFILVLVVWICGLTIIVYSVLCVDTIVVSSMRLAA